MNIRELKYLNECAVMDKENLIMDTICTRRGIEQFGDGVEFSQNALLCSSSALEEHKNDFNVNYKNVRDKIFKQYKNKRMQPVGFVKLVGKDELNNYYAVGLYDLPTAKANELTPLEACKTDVGTLIAVMPMRAKNVPDTIFESAFYDRTINLLHAKEVNGYKGLEIESYHNYMNADFANNDILWEVVEKTLKEKDKTDEFEF